MTSPEGGLYDPTCQSSEAIDVPMGLVRVTSYIFIGGHYCGRCAVHELEEEETGDRKPVEQLLQ